MLPCLEVHLPLFSVDRFAIVSQHIVVSHLNGAAMLFFWSAVPNDLSLRAEHFNGTAHPLIPFHIADHVLIQHPVTRRWSTPGIIIEVGPTVTILSKLPPGAFRRNHRHLRKRISVLPNHPDPVVPAALPLPVLPWPSSSPWRCCCAPWATYSSSLLSSREESNHSLPSSRTGLPCLMFFFSRLYFLLLLFFPPYTPTLFIFLAVCHRILISIFLRSVLISLDCSILAFSEGAWYDVIRHKYHDEIRQSVAFCTKRLKPIQRNFSLNTSLFKLRSVCGARF